MNTTELRNRVYAARAAKTQTLGQAQQDAMKALRKAKVRGSDDVQHIIALSTAYRAALMQLDETTARALMLIDRLPTQLA